LRNAFAEALYEAAKADERICVVVADISPAGSMEKFRREYPERFVNVGVAEQAMIGVAAGMAMKGLRPFCYTIATFALYRPFEMVRNDLAYQKLPVTVVGMGAGVIYSTLGSTHHAQEDIAVASAIPNMQVIAPCDPQECREAVLACAENKEGPVYLRIGKQGEPTLTWQAEAFEFGKLRYLQRGTDVCILSYGPIMKMAAEIAKRMEAIGKSVSLVSCHTLKPLDAHGIAAALRAHPWVIVLEEHSPHGGLAAQVKQIAWDAKATCQLEVATLKDEFIHCYGSHANLLAAHGLRLE
jgi:transketolase